LFIFIIFYKFYIDFQQFITSAFLRKNPARQDSPPAAGCGSNICISAAVRSLGELFNVIGNFGEISYDIKKSPHPAVISAKQGPPEFRSLIQDNPPANPCGKRDFFVNILYF